MPLNNVHPDTVGRASVAQHNVQAQEPVARADAVADAGEDIDDGEAATLSDYVPEKLTAGKPHPDPVVENSSLAAVAPPDVTYTPHLPPAVIKDGLLSSLQLESVVYAAQRHDGPRMDDGARKGFFIGDGAGIGKGRQLAGLVVDRWLAEAETGGDGPDDGVNANAAETATYAPRRRHVWVSVNADLKLDAERDLADLGMGSEISVTLLGKQPYGKLKEPNEGVLFATYASIVGKKAGAEIGHLTNSRLGQVGGRLQARPALARSVPARTARKTHGRPVDGSPPRRRRPIVPWSVARHALRDRSCWSGAAPRSTGFCFSTKATRRRT
jgi:hypothetical protein